MATTQVPGPPRPRSPLEAPPPRRWRARWSAGHVVMVIAALAAGLLNLVVLRAGDDRVGVAVVARPVAAGDALTATDLRVARVAADRSLLPGLVPAESLGTVDGWVAASELEAGQLLRRADLRRPATGDGLRAMSLPVDPAHAAGGALAPGDRVDVIEVRDGTATYAVTDAKVLAVADPGAGALGGLQTFSVTIAVDADAALRLALAIREESLEVLRSTGAEPVTTSGPPGG